jgi:hypothetical protein
MFPRNRRSLQQQQQQAGKCVEQPARTAERIRGEGRASESSRQVPAYKAGSRSGSKGSSSAGEMQAGSRLAAAAACGRRQQRAWVGAAGAAGGGQSGRSCRHPPVRREAEGGKHIRAIKRTKQRPAAAAAPGSGCRCTEGSHCSWAAHSLHSRLPLPLAAAGYPTRPQPAPQTAAHLEQVRHR